MWLSKKYSKRTYTDQHNGFRSNFFGGMVIDSLVRFVGTSTFDA